jgi:hypothetical protein
LAALRRFARPASVIERCELCSAVLPADHAHLVEPASRQLLCACEACAILFSGQVGTKYRRVPRRMRALSDFRLTDEQWDGLLIPIGLAFFFHSSPAGKVVAIYPSPAGPTESLLDLGAWADVVRDNPTLKEMEPDTEALLVNRVGEARAYYLVPIDQCYRLVGLIRSRWRGLSGGTEVWEEIGRFFATLKERSEPVGGEGDA